jgi:SdrD B-like domain
VRLGHRKLLGRLVQAVFAVGMIAVSSQLVAQQASADPTAVLSATQSISVKGVSSSSGLTAWPYYFGASGGPDESTMTLSILVQCAGSEPCRDVLVRHVVPPSITISATPQGSLSMLQSYTVTPTGFTYVLKELAPGFSGVIDLKGVFNSFTTPNGKEATFEASASGSNVSAVSVNPVTATAIAANTTNVDLVKGEGGAVGGRLGLTASRCVNEFPQNYSATAGRLAVAENNKLVVNVPVGAEPDPTTEGVWNPLDRTLTVMGSMVAANCYPQQFFVRFPVDASAEHATNVAGEIKSFTATWIGHSFGETIDRTLGTQTLSLQLGPERISGQFLKTPGGDGVRQVVPGEPEWVYQRGDRITYSISALNTSPALALSAWNQVEITDQIPFGLRIETFRENYLSEHFASLTFTTDAHPSPIVITNPGSFVNFYDPAYGISASDRVRSVKLVGTSIEPGQGAKAILEGKVESDVTDATVITNIATFVMTGDTTTQTGTVTSDIIVKTRIPLYEFRPFTIVQDPQYWPAPLEPTFFLQAASTLDPIVDPVIVDVLPAGIEFNGFIASSPSLPEPTMTKTSNWNGSGETLLVWRYPAGTVLPANSQLGFDLATRFGVSAAASVTNRLYVGSTAVTVFCGGLNPIYYVENNEFLGDGVTRRFCPTSTSASRPPGTSIEVTASAKGPLDASFVPGPGLAKGAPGASATYQLAANNTGDAELSGVTFIDVLPRPGDSSIVSTRRRNTATNTFAVTLDGIPTSSVPIVISWTSQTNICQTELDYSPVGCVSPNWALLTGSVDLSTITAIKIVRIGTLAGGESWTVDVPVSVPATATSGQIAYNSVALAATRVLTGTQLLPTESYKSGLTVPAGTGSIGDRIWEDTNGNGLDDLGEPGLPNIGVDLFGPGADGLVGTLDDALRSSTTTDANGTYLFALVDAGVWQVRVRTNTLDSAYGPSYEYDGVLDSRNNVVLGVGQNRIDIDFGYVTRRIGDFVWDDTNLNGLQDPGEPGRDGVALRLYRNGSFLIASTVSGDNPATGTIEHGWYSFSDIPQGTYRAEITIPNGLVLTPVESGNETRNSDFSASGAPDSPTVTTGISQSFTIGQNAANNANLDAGFIRSENLVTISGSFWIDENGDGLHQPTENPAYNTAELQQLKSGVWLTISTVSVSSDYSFSVLPGTYRVKLPTRNGCSIGPVDNNFAADRTGFGSFSIGFAKGGPAAQCWPLTAALNGSDPTIDSNPNTLTGFTAPFVVTLGDAPHDHLDAGYFPGFNLGDRVWLDANGNGLQDTGEVGIAGVSVRLHAQSPDGTYDPANITNATTDVDGNYSFTGTGNGTYRISFGGDATGNLPLRSFGPTQYLGTDAADDSDLNPLTGFTATFTPTADNLNLDIGLVTGTASISGLVWSDVDGDGRQGGTASEAGRGAKSVRLVLDSGGRSVSVGTALTNLDGKYSFDNLAPGKYRVEFANTDGVSRLTTQYANGAPELANDSNANAITGATEWIDLLDEAQQINVDAGYVPSVTVGDFVWVDTNGNGKQDANESGLSGVVVILEGPGPDGIYGYGWHLDNTSTFTATDVSGHYGFSGLAPGSYRMRFPVAYTKAGVVYQLGTQSADQNLSGDESIPDLGTGEVAPRVFAPGVTVDSADAGYIAGDASIGDLVWFDRNGNGIQDGNDTAPEDGIYGVTLTLYATDAVGNNLIVAGTATTDIDGRYRFSNLAPGKYRVRYSMPAGYIQSPSDINLPNNSVDSDFTNFDMDLGSNLSRLITLAPSEGVTTIDAGLALGSTIGDRVWLDNNADGVYQPEEPGAPRIPVELQKRIYPTGEMVFVPYWSTIATTTTSLTGLYAFSGLPNGEYRIFVSLTIPIAGRSYAYSPLVTGSSTTDSNLSSEGVSETITITGYTYRDDIDAGLIGTSIIGDRIWIDTDGDGLQGSGEPNLASIPVTLTWLGPDDLLGTADDIGRTALSDSNGRYDTALGRVESGRYKITVPTSINLGGVQYALTRAVDQRPTWFSDSNAIAQTGTLTISGANINDGILWVEAGSTDNSIDFGYVIVPDPTTTTSTPTTTITTTTTTGEVATTTTAEPTTTTTIAPDPTTTIVGMTSTTIPATTTTVAGATTSTTATTLLPTPSSSTTTSAPSTTTGPTATSTTTTATPTSTSATTTTPSVTTTPSTTTTTSFASTTTATGVASTLLMSSTTTVPASTIVVTTTIVSTSTTPTTTPTTTATATTTATTTEGTTTSTEPTTTAPATTIPVTTSNTNTVTTRSSVNSTIPDPLVVETTTIPSGGAVTTTSASISPSTVALGSTPPTAVSAPTSLPATVAILATISLGDTESSTTLPALLVFAPISEGTTIVGTHSMPNATDDVSTPGVSTLGVTTWDTQTTIPLAVSAATPQTVLVLPPTVSSPTSLVGPVRSAKVGTVGFLRELNIALAKEAGDLRSVNENQTVSSGSPYGFDQSSAASSRPGQSLGKSAFVYLDLNGNGEPDDDERTLAGVMVGVKLPDGRLVTIRTDENGQFSVADLPDGTYTLTLVSGLPTGLSISSKWSSKTITVAGRYITKDVGFPVATTFGPDRLALTGTSTTSTATTAFVVLAIGILLLAVTRWRKNHN